MPSKTELASRLIHSLGLTPVVRTLRSALVQDFRILAYHRVLGDFDEATYPFDSELVSARREEFDWQMAYLARHFQPVSCSEVVNAFDAGESLPRRAVMVTFDDGFSDNYEIAFPLLRRHGLSALFFLSTGYINTQRIFWFDWLVHVLLKTSAASIQLDALGVTIQPGPTRTARRAQAATLLSQLKRAPQACRLQTLRELEEATALVPSDSDRAKSAPMCWDHVREMAQAGMEFGSHTVSHPILSSITDATQLRLELETSRASLEHEIGRPVVALAYPVGGRDAINDRVLAATAQAGYRIAFTYQPGVNKLPSCDRFLLKRIHVERYTTRAMFSAALECPELFAGYGGAARMMPAIFGRRRA